MFFCKKSRFLKVISWLTSLAFFAIANFSVFPLPTALAATVTTETITAGGSWAVPANVSSFKIKLWGAGGKGGDGALIYDGAGHPGPGGGGGGGAGGYVEKTFTASAGTVFDIVIGDPSANDGTTILRDSLGGILLGATAGGDGVSGVTNGTAGAGGVGGGALGGTTPDLIVSGADGVFGQNGAYNFDCSIGFSQAGPGGSGASSLSGSGGTGGLVNNCEQVSNTPANIGGIASGGGGGAGYPGPGNSGALGGKGQVVIEYTITTPPVIPPDTTAPVISLSGANPIYIAKGATFTDPGATATDNVDASVAVVVTGSVDTTIVGSYTLTYTATDSSGNVATATRTVIVYDPLADISCPTTGSLPTVATIGSFTVLAWPGTDTTSILQSSTDLATWTTITTVPTIVNGCNTVSTTTPAIASFYQLVAPSVPPVSPTVAVTLTPSVTSGTAPLSGVTFAVTVSGTAVGSSVLDVDCDNNGAVDFSTTTNQTTFTTDGSCTYSTAGTYTAHASILRQGVSATADATINVSAPVVANGGNGGGGGGSGGGGAPSGGNGPISGTLVVSVGGSNNSPASTPASGGGIIGSGTPASAPLSCTYLNSYLGKQKQNDSAEVLKLQAFLRDTEKIDVPLNGIYDDATEVAVMAFQVKYSADVLEPWATTTPTGYAYITTVKKVNDIFCGSLDPNYAPTGLPELVPDTSIPVGAGSQIGSTATSTNLALTSEEILKGQNLEATSTLPVTGLIGLNIATTGSIATNSPPVIVRIQSNTATVFNAISSTILDALRALWERLKR